MTEAEARAWIEDRFGIAAAEKVAAFLDRVIAENALQNLISPTTVASIWARHALDSAQLLALAPAAWEHWLDVGTGGGFPGMIVALLAPERLVTMVEPRIRRAAFLQDCAMSFDLDRASVIAGKVEALRLPADVISARAVASVEKLLRAASGCAKAETSWLLPRGRSGGNDNQDGIMFHVEHSVTDEASVILVGKGKPS